MSSKLNVGLATRVVEYFRNSLEDVNSCPVWNGKFAIAFSKVGFVTTYLVNAACKKCFGRRLLRSYPGLAWDVYVKNEDGIFYCRKGSSDHEIVAPRYESRLREFFDLNGGIFVDVGAHIGKYTVMVARRFAKTGKVVAIEPEPTNFHALLRNVQLNCLENVLAFDVACSDTNGELVLHLNTSGTGSHSVAFRSRTRGGILVKARTLDSVMEELGIEKVNIIKIDVEGAEMAVLRGALHTLKRSEDVKIVFESWSEEPVRFLRGLGFNVATAIDFSGVSDESRLGYYFAYRSGL